MTHWAEPSAPDQAIEARYRRAVLSGMSREEFDAAERAAEDAANAAADAKLASAKAQGASDASRWDAIYRAAVCAAAQAIKARDWSAKRQALAIAEQADANRQVMIAAVFGRAKEVPAQYAGLEQTGRAISRDESSAALRVISADKPGRKAAPAARTGAVTVISGPDWSGWGVGKDATGAPVRLRPWLFKTRGLKVGDTIDAKELA